MKFFLLILVSWTIFGHGSFVFAEECGKNLRGVPEGYQCVTKKGVTFQLFKRNETGKETWKDLDGQAQNLYVTSLFEGLYDFEEAQKLCSDPLSLKTASADIPNVNWGLPTGWIKKYNGQYSFPNTNSDLVALEEDGFRDVLPDLKDEWLRSKTINPNIYLTFALDSKTGKMTSDGVYSTDGVICVGRPRSSQPISKFISDRCQLSAKLLGA